MLIATRRKSPSAVRRMGKNMTPQQADLQRRSKRRCKSGASHGRAGNRTCARPRGRNSRWHDGSATRAGEGLREYPPRRRSVPARL